MTSLAVLSLVLSVHAEPVKGTVHLANGHGAGAAVVYFDCTEKSHPLKKAVVDQRDRHFLPHVSVVTVGTKVEFPNNDVVFHNVFTEYHAAHFDLGMYARGRTKTQTFPTPGLAVLLCSIHSEMSAYIMVVDTPYYAVADRGGNFTIPNMPAGTYTLHAWQETGEKVTETVRVSPGKSLAITLKR